LPYRTIDRGWPSDPKQESMPAQCLDGKDEVDLYVRTYNTILRSSGDIRLRAFVQAHIGVHSNLHVDADSPRPDPGAFIYCIHRLPACIVGVKHIVIGQLPEDFERTFASPLETWEKVQAPARRRQWHFDGNDTLAVHVASPSDLDDLIPTLVAYQIEWNKLHARLRNAPVALRLWEHAGQEPFDGYLDRLAQYLDFPEQDWRRLQQIWGSRFWPTLCGVARGEKNMTVRLLGGTHVGYAKLIRRWWQQIGSVLADHAMEKRPVYFVSSNMHAIANLLSGYARRRASMLSDFMAASHEGEMATELAALREAREAYNWDNVLYYAARLWHQQRRSNQHKEARQREEEERGILTIAPVEGIDVGAQVIDLSRLQQEDLDPRLADLAPRLAHSDAIILNIDYPLGMAAYHMLRQVTETLDDLRGIYVLGKAATLNGAIGDVMISDVVFDEHSKNVYSFENAFGYQDVAPYLERGSVLDNQRSVTVKGTFLQNREYLEFFYRESYTVVEMEAGPYLSAIYEATHPTRHPLGEDVHFRHLPFDLGIIHYASDTPYTRARTLGGRSLSFEGIDSTYASAVAILRRILEREGSRAR